jgi:hypothetical protein
MLKFFDTTEVDQYADWVVEEVKRTLPPEKSTQGPKKMDRRAGGLDLRIFNQTEALARTVKLNVYKKARLTARVREQMSAHGYSQSFIDALALNLIQRLTAAGKSSR